jgi:hypothetical protein
MASQHLVIKAGPDPFAALLLQQFSRSLQMSLGVRAKAQATELIENIVALEISVGGHVVCCGEFCSNFRVQQRFDLD